MRQGSNPRRPRSRGNGKRHPQQSSRNSTFESSGPDGKVRGTAQQVYDKYLALARDALTSGDRVAAETYSQHADHYYRILQANLEEGGQPGVQGGQGGPTGQGQEGGGEQQGYDPSQQPQGQPGNQGQQHGRDGRDQFRHQHNNNQNQNYNRNQRGVPVSELREMEDDDRQPEGLDNASNDPARTTY